MSSQGCSKATIGAITLDAVLKSRRYSEATKLPADFGRDFFTIHKDKIQGIWDGTKPTGWLRPFIWISSQKLTAVCHFQDYQWDTTTPVKGEKNSDEWLMGGISKIVMDLAGVVSIL